MERLTEHHVNKKMGVYMVCSGACDDFNCTDCGKLDEIVVRLAAYEDTGLEPEDIDALQKRERGLAEMLANVSCGCVVPYTRLAELAQAEKDGMLAALPPNDPLTLEELREMDGAPVYDWMRYEWFVVSEVADDGVIMTDGTVFDIDEDSVNSAVGRFYRRKPETVKT